MAGQYFRVITTRDKPDPNGIDRCHRLHEQKLNNYMKYGQPFEDAELPISLPELSEKIEKEVESQSTAIGLTDHLIILTTTLCCENEYERGEEKGE
jgi:hypothetical protein